MIFLIISIIILLLSPLSGFLPPFFCWVGLIAIYIISIIFIILTLIDYDAHKDIYHKLAIAIAVITILLGYELMNFTHCYNEVRKELNKRFDDFEIVGVKIARNFNNNKYYQFEVIEPKVPDLIFHYSYRVIQGTNMSLYGIDGDWEEVAIPYYLKKYNKEHNIRITMRERCDKYDICYDYIYINNNKEEVEDFLDYLFSNSPDVIYKVNIYEVERDYETDIVYPSYYEHMKRLQEK